MSIGTLNLGTILLVWASLVWKLHTLRWWPRDAIQRSYCGAQLALALTLTVYHPPVYRAIDQATGIPNISRLIGGSLGIVTGWAFQPVLARLLQYQSRGQGVLGSAWLMLATIATMALLFSRMTVPISEPLDFQGRYGGQPYVAAFRLAMFAYIGGAILHLFTLSLRNVRVIRTIAQTHRRWWAWMQMVGWGLGTAYALNECVYVVLRRTPLGHDAPYDKRLANALLYGFLVSIMSGLFIELAHRVAAYITLRQLFPLWRDLRCATPQIALDPSPSLAAEILDFRDTTFRLGRRVTEIHDGLMALRPFIEESALRPSDDRQHQDLASLRAGAVAVILKDAITAKRDGRYVTQPLTTPLISAAATFEAEIGQLRRLARAYRASNPQGRATRRKRFSVITALHGLR